ncbi:hypothetical protein E5720_10405 [Rhodococcus sp. PAMC28707]|uniref:hypothetical protein n=1 Tax=unclassified Rhodococcus (in: high G+C Gram-positive bacteria) TaxID=192944 RepID=UPI00109DBF9A|nr:MULTISPECIES: hypothetical protein [unclassified Rhodococcus (in: high G+C Gram-positive bacteria)]QCB52514.1 hypothetical protein E5769_03610 [Rhodococcus sp. PAMC28705]QCB60934.1 hypothetical protein E5720_10405 [Rhodococcus sp. PAMC28707]
MVIAISFVEAPIKFKAPGVTLAIGLGIGRKVFAALNIVEVVLAVVLSVAWLYADTDGWLLLVLVSTILVVQVAVVRPPLTKRSNRVLAGDDGPRSKIHFVYIALEVVKVLLLVALTIDLLGQI